MIVPTLRQMRYVTALAREGHFGRAAEVCAISQPALSMQLRSAQVDASSARQAAEEARREVVEVRRLQVSGFAADLHADSHAESPRRGLRAVVFAPWVEPCMRGLAFGSAR